MTTTCRFIKTPRQQEATRVQCLHMHTMLYGGSRSGKTAIQIRNIIMRALKVKSRHLVARFRFNHVKQSIVYDTFPKVMELAFPGVPFTLNKSDWYVEFDNGSQIWFGGLDDKERVDKILGNEYSTIFLNECTQISWESLNTVMTRLAENTGLKLRMFYDCNPTSKKHWTYTVFKLGQTPNKEPIKNTHDYACLQMNPGDNLSNLPPEYIAMLENMPERQRIRFLEGEFQDDVEGALWNFDMILSANNKAPRELKKKVLAVDPAITNNVDSDETGIVLCGLDVNNHGRVLKDFSIKASTNEWANRVVNAFWAEECNEVVVEVNQGGDMVRTIIHGIDPSIPIVEVRASTGKFARAEPIQALYQQDKVGHDDGLADLETQMTEYVPMNSKKSPDRLDAMVWGLTHLMIADKPKPRARNV